MPYNLSNTLLILFYCCISLESLGCNKKQAAITPSPDPCYYNGVDTCLLNVKTKIQVDIFQEKQTIHSFGASDCWTAKFIGKWADESKKNQVADYLFSTDTSGDGSPKGIGLTMWRFNIGAGSFEQGSASAIPDEWRREECFLNNTGAYDWTKEAGGQWFLNAAKTRNVKYTVGFTVSPPVYMTKDGLAHGAGGKTLNLKTGLMPDFAKFLSTVSAHFNFDYLSPVNEPQWNWGASPSQEGSAATNTEIADITKLLGPALQSAGVKTKLVVGEAAQWNFITAPYDSGRGDQATEWFSSGSPNFIGNVSNVEKVISGHGYFTTCPNDFLINTRTAVSNKAKAVDPGLQLWQTEFGILGDICGAYNGYPRNTSIDYGLYVAKCIHHDLVFANVSSWSWWLAMSPYDYSDALVYINDANGNINTDNTKNSGIVLDSKQLWCMGNFSRFIRPGMKRIAAGISGVDDLTSANSVMVSAYKDEIAKKLVMVIINLTGQARKFTIDGSGFSIPGNIVDAYTTSGNKSLKHSSATSDNIIAEARSVTTLVSTYL